jgi:predicted RNA-binding Zn-ribbon protein involved in translation (DUF1610 family)
MIFKVRCAFCKTVLEADESARGRVFKCPNCFEEIEIPLKYKKNKLLASYFSKKTKRVALVVCFLFAFVVFYKSFFNSKRTLDVILLHKEHQENNPSLIQGSESRILLNRAWQCMVKNNSEFKVEFAVDCFNEIFEKHPTSIEAKIIGDLQEIVLSEERGPPFHPQAGWNLKALISEALTFSQNYKTLVDCLAKRQYSNADKKAIEDMIFGMELMFGRDNLNDMSGHRQDFHVLIKMTIHFNKNKHVLKHWTQEKQ